MSQVVVCSPFAASPLSFLDALDRLRDRGISQLGFSSEASTQHPDFVWMLSRCLERGFSVVVRSSGLIPHCIVRTLERLSPDRFTLQHSTVIPGEVWPHVLEQQSMLFSRLGPRIAPVLNLLFTSIKLDYLLDWIDDHRLRREIYLDLQPEFADSPLLDEDALLGWSQRAKTRKVRFTLLRDPFPSLELLVDGRVHVRQPSQVHPT